MTTNHQTARRGPLAQARLDLANAEARADKFKREAMRLRSAIRAHRDMTHDNFGRADATLWAAIEPGAAKRGRVGAVS
jgi:hypothetical protein